MYFRKAEKARNREKARQEKEAYVKHRFTDNYLWPFLSKQIL